MGKETVIVVSQEEAETLKQLLGMEDVDGILLLGLRIEVKIATY